MSTPVGFQKPPGAWEPPPTKPLDESVWQAWVAKGRQQDRRGREARFKAVKWISLLGLFAALGMWSEVAPYEVVVRFVVTVGSLAVMFQALQTRRFTFAVAFGAVALLFNPVAPAFSFTGDWQRALLVASGVPFVVSLAWRNERLATNG